MPTAKFMKRKAWAICLSKTGDIRRICLEKPYMNGRAFETWDEKSFYEIEYFHIERVEIVRAKK